MKLNRKIMALLTAGCLCLGTAGGVMAAEKGIESPVRGCAGRFAACIGPFIDENGDGICDNRGGGRNFIDENGDGVCDNRGGRRNFIDENGDGVCDNRGGRQHRRARHQ